MWKIKSVKVTKIECCDKCGDILDTPGMTCSCEKEPLHVFEEKCPVCGGLLYGKDIPSNPADTVFCNNHECEYFSNQFMDYYDLHPEEKKQEI